MSRANAVILPAGLQRYSAPPLCKEGRGFFMRRLNSFGAASQSVQIARIA
jgi:hypothetical protein